MIKKVISGGQTGADQSGWRSAKAVGIDTGGWMPKGFLTEDGPRPEFAELYGAQEHQSPKYPPRTRANILWADATFIFETSGSKFLNGMSRGTQLAVGMLISYEKPSVIIATRLSEPPSPKSPPGVVAWLTEMEVRILNIAGNRESSAPGIGSWVEAYMTAVFRLLLGHGAVRQEQARRAKATGEERIS
jgi:Circularly permutated YpsA SLOG family